MPLADRPKSLIELSLTSCYPRYTSKLSYKGKTNTAFPGAFPKNTFSLAGSLGDNIAFDLVDGNASARKTILHKDPAAGRKYKQKGFFEHLARK